MEKTIEKKRIYTGKLLKLNANKVRLPSGRTSFREYVAHPGAAAAVPFISEDKIILIRQYRYAISGDLLEIPAGVTELGESPEDTITRELIEETGYKANKIESLGWFYPSPGYTDEKIHLFKASELQLIQKEPQEEIELVEVLFKEALLLIEKGEIIDGKTIIALLICNHSSI